MHLYAFHPSANKKFAQPNLICMCLCSPPQPITLQYYNSLISIKSLSLPIVHFGVCPAPNKCQQLRAGWPHKKDVAEICQSPYVSAKFSCFPENFPFMQKLRIQFLGFLHHGHFEELKVMPSEARLKNFETWILNFTTV